MAVPGPERDGMSPSWIDDVTRFASVLEATQQDLLATLRMKRRALVSGSSEDLSKLTAAAQEAAKRLRQLTDWRTSLLDLAHQSGAKGNSLSDVLAESASPRHEHLRARFLAVQQRFGEAQRESWIQWIIAQRAGAYYTDILELLAQGGQRSPIYGDAPDALNSSGGAVLDAAV